ncbi:hypothetical protein ACFYPK_31870 [Streptomyces halstedii]|uniref:hypothetical protein n=1 Tax=Streptomyces halstedii TaxID=1944 RepID=UPI003460B8FB
MTVASSPTSVTTTGTWHLTVDDPILLTLHGWRAARSAPGAAELLGYGPPYRMSESLALALLIDELGASAVAGNACDYGLRVTCSSRGVKSARRARRRT